ncbi:hypothetical protein Hanom_Chr08g00705011 [Helianthus anomalus]
MIFSIQIIHFDTSTITSHPHCSITPCRETRRRLAGTSSLSPEPFSSSRRLETPPELLNHRSSTASSSGPELAGEIKSPPEIDRCCQRCAKHDTKSSERAVYLSLNKLCSC